MSKITLVKADGNRFIPAYDSDWQMARKIKTGAIITVSFVKERNILLHKKFFSLINLVFDNQEIYTNIDDLRKDLTIEAGFYEEVSNMFTGEVYRKAKSINFSSMDDVEFSELYKAMIDTVVRVFGWSGKDIEENILEYM